MSNVPATLAQMLPTKPELRAVKPGRYMMVPPPPSVPRLELDLKEATSLMRPKTDTIPVPPDDRSLDEFVADWQEQAKQLRVRLMDKVKSISTDGRQGNLGLTAESNERTPSQAVAYIVKQLSTEKRLIDSLCPLLSATINELMEQERLDVP